MSAQSPAPFTVMIVEDHPEQRKLLELILQKEGYRVLSAWNGLEAWEKLEKEDAQLILLDLMLPEMDGLELLRRIRHSERLKDIFVIIISARIQENEYRAGPRFGSG